MTKPSGDSTQPLQALREMFTNDKQMQISQDADGVIRMREADVPRDLLDVKIAHLSFDDQEKKGVPMYDPYFVLSFILGAPEVQAFMKGHGILRRGLLHEITVDPDQRVKGELNNVTLSEALDYMMKTFRGILVHENCPGVGKVDRVVVFAFFQIGQEPATRTARP